ncbi:MAG: gamma-glutamylcyclotransferase [Aquabacterium sp.]|uniref:gamma-glutamylcyclotransferase family protein n=1 Tax=Aquabacterium sp. TaxID=1872578 RepID=UPI0012057D39|nr:gamma-glutamylcyclotransferase family protein [Aquabacterium sp.]TAK83191.1 MAG: gamma-glutamylcyclotransferase [Aquabacterium sp.]
MMHYFAYGSNMDERQMAVRCPGAVAVGKAVLADYRLAFTIYSSVRRCGCADIVKSRADNVWGLLYRLTERDMLSLDAYEGAPAHYRRLTIIVSDVFGNDVEAEAYEVANKEREHQKPSDAYLGMILDASARYGFPEDYRGILERVVCLSRFET